MTPTILVTGFGPYPGVPRNPSAALVQALALSARRRGVRFVGHVFATSYGAVDRELPALLARYRPHAVLMFGVAPRRRGISIETRAQNTTQLLPDASGATRGTQRIEARGPARRRLAVPAVPFAAALRRNALPASVSHDAGRYLCNYIAWRATVLAPAHGAQLVAFVHIPMPAVRKPRRRGGPSRMTLAQLQQAAGRLLAEAIRAARRN